MFKLIAVIIALWSACWSFSVLALDEIINSDTSFNRKVVGDGDTLLIDQAIVDGNIIIVGGDLTVTNGAVINGKIVIQESGTFLCNSQSRVNGKIRIIASSDLASDPSIVVIDECTTNNIKAESSNFDINSNEVLISDSIVNKLVLENISAVVVENSTVNGRMKLNDTGARGEILLDSSAFNQKILVQGSFSAIAVNGLNTRSIVGEFTQFIEFIITTSNIDGNLSLSSQNGTNSAVIIDNNSVSKNLEASSFDETLILNNSVEKTLTITQGTGACVAENNSFSNIISNCN